MPDACPGILDSLWAIEKIVHELQEDLPERFEYSHVFQQQLNRVTDQWSASGALSKEVIDTSMGKMRKPAKPLSADATFARASVYNLPRGCTLIRTQKDASARAILRLLRGAKEGLETGDCLVAFICYRSVLEQVGHLASFVRDAAKLPSGEGFEDSYKYLLDLTEVAAQRLYGTRVGWSKIAAAENLEDLIKKNQISYQADPERLDQTSKSCLSGVDLVDKKIRGTRAIYEILCEFAHPNVGALIVSTVDAIPETGSDGVTWIHKSLHSGPPFSFLKDCSNVATIVFETVANVTGLAKQLLADCDREAATAQGAAKRVIPRYIANNKKLFDPYAVCPCGSGDKIRFCCGRIQK